MVFNTLGKLHSVHAVTCVIEHKTSFEQPGYKAASWLSGRTSIRRSFAHRASHQILRCAKPRRHISRFGWPSGGTIKLALCMLGRTDTFSGVGEVLPSRSVHPTRTKLAKDRKDLGWVAASGVVGADVSVLDDPIGAYHVTSWHRQCPTRLIVHGGEVEAGFQFGGLQFSGELPTKAKRKSHLPATVNQTGE